MMKSLSVGAALALATSSLMAADLEGRLAYENSADLAFGSAGIVSEVMVKLGDKVKKGDTLVKLDDRAYRAAAKAAALNLDAASLNYDEAKREYDRAKEMYDRTALSEHERVIAEIAVRRADVEYAQVQAASIEAQMALEQATIKAPFDGVVSWVEVGLGEYVNNSLAVNAQVGVVNTGSMIVSANITAEDAAKIGQSVSVSAGGKSLSVESVSVSVEADQAGTYPVVVRVKAAEGLRAGQAAIISY
jgi:multidrug efflux system membrane fusion protein